MYRERERGKEIEGEREDIYLFFKHYSLSMVKTYDIEFFS